MVAALCLVMLSSDCVINSTFCQKRFGVISVSHRKIHFGFSVIVCSLNQTSLTQITQIMTEG